MDMVLANHNPSHPNEARCPMEWFSTQNKSSLTPPRSGAPPLATEQRRKARCGAEPEVRIQSPPAASQERTVAGGRQVPRPALRARRRSPGWAPTLRVPRPARPRADRRADALAARIPAGRQQAQHPGVDGHPRRDGAVTGQCAADRGDCAPRRQAKNVDVISYQ
jgi:hypothetical protein